VSGSEVPANDFFLTSDGVVWVISGGSCSCSVCEVEVLEERSSGSGRWFSLRLKVFL
jgi:hypothetical protein